MRNAHKGLIAKYEERNTRKTYTRTWENNTKVCLREMG
jgi:hypothetical protein